MLINPVAPPARTIVQLDVERIGWRRTRHATAGIGFEGSVSKDGVHPPRRWATRRIENVVHDRRI